ncbi:MAG: signal recognition particle-docking protein FtsY, partial [Pseudomonadota bacterium]
MVKWFKRDKPKTTEKQEPAADKEGEAGPVSAPQPSTPTTAEQESPAAPSPGRDSSFKEAEAAEEKKGFLNRLRERLSGTRAVLTTRVDHLLLGVREIDADVLEELEEILI